METTITVTVDKDTLEQAKDILGYIDVNMAVNILLNRIAQERNISFLLGSPARQQAESIANVNETTNAHQYANTPNNRYRFNTFEEFAEPAVLHVGQRMVKSIAIARFRQDGINDIHNNNTTFSSQNATQPIYWANPDINVLHQNWYLILNDINRKQLHLFSIPANSISDEEVVMRSDDRYPNLIDFQFNYNDPTFTDRRSKLSFVDFHIKTITY